MTITQVHILFFFSTPVPIHVFHTLPKNQLRVATASGEFSKNIALVCLLF